MTAAKKIQHADFAHRMQLACDGNTRVPPHNHGRLGWFVDQFEEKFDHKLTIETIRKWFAGEARPRAKTLGMLAQVLQVDEAWLSVGSDPALTEKQRKVRNAAADGVVNVVAGCIQIDGGHPAFPDEADTQAKEKQVDITAIIKGALYMFHVTLGEKGENGWTFTVPADAQGAFVIGVVRIKHTCFRFFELDWDGIEEFGAKRQGYFTLTLPFDAGDSRWEEITSFEERL